MTDPTKLPPKLELIAANFGAAASLRIANTNAANQPTDTLFHYTSEAVLDEIINTNIFWFTSIYHMDDPMRNNFGAHAGGWRWWDQSELFEDFDVTEIGKLSLTVLENAADLEPKFRTIEPSPTDWPTWLFENFDMLWDTVWFDKLSKR